MNARRAAKRWFEYLVAILIGNALYFLILTPHLPEPLRHQTFQVDWGLAADFAVCLGVYALFRWAGWFKSNN
jgi:hypothetical protein